MGKLPMETRRNLAREHSNLEWTIDELRTAILKEIQILEQGLFVTSSTSHMNSQGPLMTAASLYLTHWHTTDSTCRF